MLRKLGVLMMYFAEQNFRLSRLPVPCAQRRLMNEAGKNHIIIFEIALTLCTGWQFVHNLKKSRCRVFSSGTLTIR